jgi:hypothetical protein
MPSHVARAFSYDPAERRLDVRFTSGRDYSYYDVPPDMFEAIRGRSPRARSSIGKSGIATVSPEGLRMDIHLRLMIHLHGQLGSTVGASSNSGAPVGTSTRSWWPWRAPTWLCVSDHHHAPAPWASTADFAYVRGHGPGGRYSGSYSEFELDRWAEHIGG